MCRTVEPPRAEAARSLAGIPGLALHDAEHPRRLGSIPVWDSQARVFRERLHRDWELLLCEALVIAQEEPGCSRVPDRASQDGIDCLMSFGSAEEFVDLAPSPARTALRPRFRAAP